MLSNILADNFQTIDSIDWEFVKTFSEFKGHTVKSLKCLFYDTLLRWTAERLKVDKTELSLKQIAEDAKVSYNKENARQIPEKTKIRQMKVVNHFESQVKKFDIKDFL